MDSVVSDDSGESEVHGCGEENRCDSQTDDIAARLLVYSSLILD